MSNAGAEGPMNLQAAAAGSVASLLTVSLLNSTPMPAGLDGEEKRLLAQFIETDIHHRVSAQAICKTASASAEASAPLATTSPTLISTVCVVIRASPFLQSSFHLLPLVRNHLLYRQHLQQTGHPSLGQDQRLLLLPQLHLLQVEGFQYLQEESLF